jgi:hypothetical protein
MEVVPCIYDEEEDQQVAQVRLVFFISGRNVVSLSSFINQLQK